MASNTCVVTSGRLNTRNNTAVFNGVGGVKDVSVVISWSSEVGTGGTASAKETSAIGDEGTGMREVLTHLGFSRQILEKNSINLFGIEYIAAVFHKLRNRIAIKIMQTTF